MRIELRLGYVSPPPPPRADHAPATRAAGALRSPAAPYVSNQATVARIT